MSRSLLRAGVATLAAVGLAGGVSACTSDPNSVAEQAKQGDNKGYIAGDGSAVVFDADKRSAPVELKGDTLDGGTWQAADHRGKIVVVNLWASWCGPCAKEAPHLVELNEEWTDKGADKDPDVVMVGIDYKDSVATGKAQAEAWGFTWPSINDRAGVTPLQMDGKLTTQPSTAVLDREGRIAAVVLGVVEKSTLRGLVEDVAAEKAA